MKSTYFRLSKKRQIYIMAGIQARTCTGTLYRKVTDTLRYVATANGLTAGDCQSKSLHTWYKMRKAGAKRMRGRRMTERLFEGLNVNRYHYFVVNKGMIFDQSMGVTQIAPAEAYYKDSEMQDLQESDCGAWFADELETENAANYVRSLCENPENIRKLQILIGNLLLQDEKELRDVSGNLHKNSDEQLMAMCDEFEKI